MMATAAALLLLAATPLAAAAAAAADGGSSAAASQLPPQCQLADGGYPPLINVTFLGPARAVQAGEEGLHASRGDAGIVQTAALHVCGRGASPCKPTLLLLGSTHSFSVAVLNCSASHSVINTHLPRPPQVALTGRTTALAMPRPASRRWR